MSLLASLVFAAMLANLLPDVQSILPLHCDIQTQGEKTNEVRTIHRVMDEPGVLTVPDKCTKPGSDLAGVRVEACDTGNVGFPRIMSITNGDFGVRIELDCDDCDKFDVTVDQFCKPFYDPDNN